MFLPLASGNNLEPVFKEGLYNQHRLEYLVYHTQDSWKSFVLKMYYEHLNHDAFSDQILIGMMTYLSADTMRRFQDTMESSYSSSHTRGLEDFLVLNYIQEHIDTVTLADISRHFGFSLLLLQTDQNTTGMGFSEWKRALRVRKGERLLVNTTNTINDISLSLGYENTETFIRIFKKGNRHDTRSISKKQSKKDRLTGLFPLFRLHLNTFSASFSITTFFNASFLRSFSSTASFKASTLS